MTDFTLPTNFADLPEEDQQALLGSIIADTNTT